MRYAAISTNHKLAYAFYAPLCSLHWRLHGFTPLLILVGTAEQWLDDTRLRLVLERSREVGAVIHFVAESIVPPSVVESATIAQCARLFAAHLPGIHEDDSIVTGDVDMLTLGEWPGGVAREGDSLQLYFSNAYAGGPCPHDGGKTEHCPCFPICYVRASARVWREIVPGSDIPSLPMRALGFMLMQVPTEPTLRWNFDEKWLGERIRAWPGFATRAQLIPRDFTPGQWRLDRSDWRVGDAAWRAEHLKSLSGIADAHLPRPGYTEDGWASIRPLLEMSLPPKMLAWADEYREAFSR